MMYGVHSLCKLSESRHVLSQNLASHAVLVLTLTVPVTTIDTTVQHFETG